jgi:hypothetical protein
MIWSKTKHPLSSKKWLTSTRSTSSTAVDGAGLKHIAVKHIAKDVDMVPTGSSLIQVRWTMDAPGTLRIMLIGRSGVAH